MPRRGTKRFVKRQHEHLVERRRRELMKAHLLVSFGVTALVLVALLCARLVYISKRDNRILTPLFSRVNAMPSSDSELTSTVQSDNNLMTSITTLSIRTTTKSTISKFYISQLSKEKNKLKLLIVSEKESERFFMKIISQ